MGAERRAFCVRCPPIFYHFRHVIKQIGMLQSARPAAQNEITTCLKTFEKEGFCNFSHRHGEATGKPETRDETHGSNKTSISYEISSNFHNWKPSKRINFATSPINTARLLGATKPASRARLPPIFILGNNPDEQVLQLPP